MRVLLKTVLDCPVDAAWNAIRNPAVLTEVSSPLVAFGPAEGSDVDIANPPAVWPQGEHLVAVRAFGLVPLGEQVIGISYPERSDDVRVMRDDGRALWGALATITYWQHTMTVTATADGRTLYRDRLVLRAGPLTPVVWFSMWAFWQWRARGMRRLAPTWR